MEEIGIHSKAQKSSEPVSSNTSERIEFFESFLESIEDCAIDCLVADREFIGADWFYCLLNYPRYRFHIRLKASHHIGYDRQSLRADVVFANLSIGETRILGGKTSAMGFYRSLCQCKAVRGWGIIDLGVILSTIYCVERLWKALID